MLPESKSAPSVVDVTVCGIWPSVFVHSIFWPTLAVIVRGDELDVLHPDLDDVAGGRGGLGRRQPRRGGCAAGALDVSLVVVAAAGDGAAGGEREAGEERWRAGVACGSSGVGRSGVGDDPIPPRDGSRRTTVTITGAWSDSRPRSGISAGPAAARPWPRTWSTPCPPSTSKPGARGARTLKSPPSSAGPAAGPARASRRRRARCPRARARASGPARGGSRTTSRRRAARAWQTRRSGQRRSSTPPLGADLPAHEDRVRAAAV